MINGNLNYDYNDIITTDGNDDDGDECTFVTGYSVNSITVPDGLTVVTVTLAVAYLQMMMMMMMTIMMMVMTLRILR